MQRKRNAFTLIELLVVIAIIALLGGLLVFVMPGFQDRQRAAKGGQALQGWLSYARQRALFEQAPRGIRLLFTTKTYQSAPPVTVTIVTECQYLEQPDDYIGGQLTMPDPAKRNEIKVDNANFADGSVEIGDYLEVLATCKSHHIFDIRPSDPKNAPAVFDLLVLSSELSPNAISTPITQYRIQRKARVAGDEPMTLPTGIIVDLSLIAKYSNFGGFYPTVKFSDAPANTQGHIDVMFGPSGAMLETGGDKLILWVRKEPPQAGTDNEFDGNPTLVVVYVNSGAVAAYNPFVGANPYSAIK